MPVTPSEEPQIDSDEAYVNKRGASIEERLRKLEKGNEARDKKVDDLTEKTIRDAATLGGAAAGCTIGFAIASMVDAIMLPGAGLLITRFGMSTTASSAVFIVGSTAIGTVSGRAFAEGYIRCTKETK